MAFPEAPFFIESVDGGFNEAFNAVLDQQPELIIEGGSNSNPALINLIRPQYQGPYVGMDLKPELVYRPTRFTVYGNCLRPDHVLPIAKRHNASRIALVTHNALGAILSDELLFGDHKELTDQIELFKAIKNITTLYAVQMHVGLNAFLSTLARFYRECTNYGWKVRDYGGNNQFMVLTRDNN